MTDSSTDQDKYKNSLNLPHTSFPMKASLADQEPKRLSSWSQQNLYERVRQFSSGRKKFILHDGPPYANGAIHIGHAVNKIVKDFIIKSKTLSGYDAPFIPGWDCHGLPIELQVEKKAGKPPVKLSYNEFRQKCRDYAAKQVEIQKSDFIRLGVFADWEQPYLTMNPATEAATVDALAKIIAAGHLYKGFKPVHWCLDCASSLAEAEVEYQDKQSDAIDVGFELLDASRLAEFASTKLPKKIYLPIWTTTPWTLPANRAVAVNKDFKYAVVAFADLGIICSHDLLENLVKRFDLEDYKLVGECTGADLEGLELQHPFEKRSVPIVISDHVSNEAGTGAVHIAPSHGVDDYTVGLKYKLDMDSPVNARGVLVTTDERLNNKHISKVNAVIIEMLQESGNLLAHKKIQHSYPHCWRHKKPIIFRATPQWFIGMDIKDNGAGLLSQAKASIDNIEWLPSWGKERMSAMLTDRPDWCISRQRCWGTPIPLFIHQQTGQLHPRSDDIMSQVSDKIAQQGIDYWFNLQPEEILGDEAEEYLKVNDTLDVWFDSGVTHSSVLEQFETLEYPADLYVEGSDQHRGWFQSSLLTSTAINGQPPFKQVLTHGFVVDEKGYKMSKSVGNVISPQQIVNKYGADILRLWVASSDFSKEMTISDAIIKNTSDLYRRIRNTARFLLANLHDFVPTDNTVALDSMLPLDKWVVDHAYQVQQEIVASYEEYNFAKVVNLVHNFCANELGGFYLDVIKDRQYTMLADSLARRSCQTAMHQILQAMVKWVAPVLSFTSEEINQYIPGNNLDSVFLSLWYDGLQPVLEHDQSMNREFWSQIIAVRAIVNKALEQARVEGIIGASLDAQVTINASQSDFEKLTVIAHELKFVFIVSHVEITLSQEANTTVQVNNYDKKKCVRCWHKHSSVGEDSEHPQLCNRCISNVTTDAGEVRLCA